MHQHSSRSVPLLALALLLVLGPAASANELRGSRRALLQSSPNPGSPPPANSSAWVKPVAAAPFPAPNATVPVAPTCPPLKTTDVLVPDATLRWLGDFSQGLSSFAPEFGGNVTGLVEDSVLVFGNDPTVPDGTRATGVVMVTYAANMTGPDSGVNFLIYPFGENPIGNQVRLQYKVMFEDGFDFSTGGTLPGLFQGPVGDTPDQQPCSGTWQVGDQGVECFNIRPLWRASGKVELNMYLPKSGQPCQLLEYAKWGDANQHMGVALVSDDYKLKTLTWYTVDLYVKLNEIGKSNGAVALSLNGEPIITFPNSVIRTSEEQTVDAVAFSTYYLGGPGVEIPTQDQHVLFKDFRLLVRQGAPTPAPTPSPSPSEEAPTPEAAPTPSPAEPEPAPSPVAAPSPEPEPALPPVSLPPLPDSGSGFSDIPLF